jgi:hypothetical protein
MKINIEIDLTPDEAKDLFVPGDKQTEFQMKTYDAYTKALQDLVWDQIDPYNMFNRKNKDD